jgi:spore coat polysaccharide biosynthesis predicted glycosyltransferase SpsG|tara:strand:- start:2369 stop:3394 length:1026 start_codon:yes stop_codon:yes gene_type:complete
VSFFKHKVLFRCDAADIPEIGTGHLYRCLVIAQLLKGKFRLKNKDIAFLVKSKNHYKKSLKILSFYKFKVIKIKDSKLKPNSIEEANYLLKHPSKLLILDRLGKSNLDFFNLIKNSFKKKVIIDDSSKIRRYFDLSLNPLIQNVVKFKNSYIGFNYLILPTLFIKKKFRVSKNNIFLFFGGYDKKNITINVIKILNTIPYKINMFVQNNLKKKIKEISSKNNIFFFNHKNYLSTIRSSNIAITAGGMGLFDALYLNKKILCIPQYKHQEINAKRVYAKKAINLIKIEDKNFKNKFRKLFLKIYKSKMKEKKLANIQKKIIDLSKLRKTSKLIFSLYEKSKY